MSAKRVVLAEYFTTEDHTLLFIVREDFNEPQVIQLNTPQDEMRRYVIETFGTADSVRNMDDLGLAEWHTRFGQVVEPILQWADEDDIIWIVPHDVLHHVPLHAVKVEGRYLIERNRVCYSPSASVMKYCHAKRKGRRQHALVIGDPRHDLTHAREEAYTVAGLFGTEPLLGDAATISRIKSLLEEQRDCLDILHFACHGELDRAQALNSGILVAKEPQEAEGVADQDSGKLTAAEIFNLQLNADLVTLSACDSGVNERKPGDELIGLTRALIYAGTPSVLVSLWSVDDLSTRLLMERFYLELRKEPRGERGQRVSKAEALQTAQRFLMNMTATELVARYQQQLASLPDTDDSERRTQLELDCALAHNLAGDLPSALATCRSVIERLDAAPTGFRPQIQHRAKRDLGALEEVQVGSRARQTTDRPFEHMFYWAPFVLVGDWK